ncbi:MAG: D-alanine--D-alanine ligase [Bacteroidaceae bacterium]|nr:D-alanine--D-alanine ligase [Bacteroidaceae bacterium]
MKKIAIVAGGDSSEHDVSMRSAAGIMSFMDHTKYDCTVVELTHEGWHAICGEERCPIDRNDFSYTLAGQKRNFDFAYITIHGTPGEDGILQGYFDLIGMPYSTSGVLVEALTFNKYALNAYLRSLFTDMPEGVPQCHVSDSILVRKGLSRPTDQAIADRLGLPCFVKPNAGGSSFGVTKVKTLDQLTPAIEKAMLESDEVMVERMMTGMEITSGAYRKGDEVVCFPLTEVALKGVEFFDYDAKYEGKSDEITPARIADSTRDRVWALTQHIYRALNCYGIIRIDYILSGEAGHEKINILEINTTPGMTAASFIPQQVRASGTPISEVLSDIIEGRL